MPESSHAAFLEEAIRIAVENVRTGRGGPFGAVVVRDGSIIARGANRVTVNLDPTAHAEVVAIREACRALGSFQLTGCDLYCSTEPCPMCLGAIYWARAERVFFAATHRQAAASGFDDHFIYDELTLPLDERRLPIRRIVLPSADTPFLEWDASPDKVEY